MLKKLRRFMFALSGSAAALLIYHLLRQRAAKPLSPASEDNLINLDEVLPEENPLSERISIEAETPVGSVEITKPVPESKLQSTTVSGTEASDLKRIEGIGPKTSVVLNEAGITTFQALADHTPEEIKDILRAAKSRGVPTSWPAQAKLAAAEDWDGLAKLQNDLKGGR